MTDAVGKIEQLGEGVSVLMLKPGFDILNPKLMTPICSLVWEWYKTVAPRLKMALINRDGAAVEDIIDEIEAHAVEIEYQCRI
jgi:hypothetical protein